jgi:hypothetical protein
MNASKQARKQSINEANVPQKKGRKLLSMLDGENQQKTAQQNGTTKSKRTGGVFRCCDALVKDHRADRGFFLLFLVCFDLF